MLCGMAPSYVPLVFRVCSHAFSHPLCHIFSVCSLLYSLSSLMPFLNLTRTLFNIVWNYRHQSRADLHKTKTFKFLKTFFLNVSLKRLSEAIRDEIMKKNIKCQHFPAPWKATVQGRVYDSLVFDLYHSTPYNFSSGCFLGIYLHFAFFILLRLNICHESTTHIHWYGYHFTTCIDYVA